MSQTDLLKRLQHWSQSADTPHRPLAARSFWTLINARTEKMQPVTESDCEIHGHPPDYLQANLSEFHMVIPLPTSASSTWSYFPFTSARSNCCLFKRWSVHVELAEFDYKVMVCCCCPRPLQLKGLESPTTSSRLSNT